MEAANPNYWYFILGGGLAVATILSFLLAFWKVITKDKIRDMVRDELKEFMEKDFKSLQNRTYQNSDDIRAAQNVQVNNTHNIEMLDSNIHNLEKIVNNHYELHTKSFDKLDTRLESIDNQLRIFLSSVKINTD